MVQEVNRRQPFPSSQKLVGSVIIAALAAAAILILTVLPAAYEIDLIGAGRLLRLIPTDEERAQALAFDPPLIPQAPTSPSR